MKLALNLGFIAVIATSIVAFSCKKDDTTDNTGNTGTVDITNAVRSNYTGSATVSASSGNLVIKSNGLPNHKTPYWGAGNALYEDFPPSYHANVNTSMSAHNYSMTIPDKPGYCCHT